MFIQGGVNLHASERACVSHISCGYWPPNLHVRAPPSPGRADQPQPLTASGNGRQVVMYLGIVSNSIHREDKLGLDQSESIQHPCSG